MPTANKKELNKYISNITKEGENENGKNSSGTFF
jgi:hypothetical protein